MREKLTKVFGSNQSLSFAGNMAAAGFGVLNIMMLARVLPLDQFGSWVLFLTLNGFFEMFRAGFIRVGLVRNAPANPQAVYGSAWIIGIIVTAIIALLVAVVGYLYSDWTSDYNIDLFTIYFPLLYFINLPQNFTFWIQQSNSRFGVILISRLIQVIPYTAFLGYGMLYDLTLRQVAIGFITSFALSSLVSFILNWCEWQSFKSATREWINKLMNFGKYSVGNVIGTNLLKSSDTILLNWFLGPEAVALYNVPYKIIEMIEIPVRSIVGTVLPQLANASHEGDNNKVSGIFQKNAGALTIITIPLLILCLVFAEELVILLGGAQYAESASILRIFCVYGLFLPVDRMIGISLDAMDKPQFNLRKIIVMLFANVIGDLIVLHYFPSIDAVAWVTIFTINVGVIAGHHFLQKQIPSSVGTILPAGARFLKEIMNKYKS